MPSLAPVLDSAFMRGAVSGVGAITVLAGLAELTGVLAQRHRRHEPPAAPSS
jgi:hypothetical protein